MHRQSPQCAKGSCRPMYAALDGCVLSKLKLSPPWSTTHGFPRGTTMQSAGMTRRVRVTPPAAIVLALLTLLLAVLGVGVSQPARAATPLSQCNGVANQGGQEVACTVTVVNNLNLATGLGSSTTTVTVCSGAAASTTCTTTPTSATNVITSVDQCNDSAGGSGGVLTCEVDVTNNITGNTTATPATVNQCVGSGTGGGTDPTVSCSPIGSTTSATVTQCNGSGNGGGATMRVLCTVDPSTQTPALLVTINQCNGSANGGGAKVTCRSKLANRIIAPAVAPAPPVAPPAVVPTPTATATPTVSASPTVTPSSTSTPKPTTAVPTTKPAVGPVSAAPRAPGASGTGSRGGATTAPRVPTGGAPGVTLVRPRPVAQLPAVPSGDLPRTGARTSETLSLGLLSLALGLGLVVLGRGPRRSRHAR